MNKIQLPLVFLAVSGNAFAVLTAVDDGSAGTPFFSVGQSQVQAGFSVTANDTDAGDIFSFDSISAKSAAVTLFADGTGIYDPRSSGDARELASGETLIDTFNYTVLGTITDGTDDLLSADTGENFSTAWGLLPATAPGTGPGFPSTFTLAYDFDGSGGATRGSFDSLSQNSASFTFWLRPDVVNANQTIFETGGTGDGSGLYINDDGTVSYVVKNQSNDAIAQSTTTLTAGEWYHIVTSYERGDGAATDTVALYINGASEGSVTATDVNDWSGSDGAGLGVKNGTSAGEVLDIDGDTITNEAYGMFDGQIAEVRFYAGQALTLGEATTNFTAPGATDSATVTVEVTGANDAPDAHDDFGGTTLANASLSSTESLLTNDGPVRFTPKRANINCDASIAFSGSTWFNVGVLQASGGDFTVSGAVLDTSPGSARPGITAAVDFDDTTGGSATMAVGLTGNAAIETFPENLDTQDATIEVWAKLAAGDLTQISTLFETGGGSGFGLVVDNGVLKAATELDGGGETESFVSYDLVTDSLGLVGGDPTSEFNQYAVSLEISGGLKLYVNGVEVDTSASGVSGDWSGSDPAGIGKFAGTNHGGFTNSAAATPYNTQFKGSMAAFRIYGSILDANEVASAFAAVAEPRVDTLYANYDASSAGDGTTWPNLGSLKAQGGDFTLSGVTLDTSPGSARAGITSALDFDDASGGSGTMDVGGNNGLNDFSTAAGPIDTADLSVEFWVKLHANDLTQISTLFETGGGSGFGVVVDNGVLKGAVGIGEAETSYDLTTDPLGLLSTPGDPTTEFFQVAFAIDYINKSTTLYVNGTRVDNGSGITIVDLDGGDAAGLGRYGEANHGGFQNGASGTSYDTSFRGSMAIFRVYGTDLTEAQVRQNYIAVDAGTDVDGDSLAVTGIVDGSGTLQGLSSPATLSSGAIVTLDSATGGFTYDPNGAFDGVAFGATGTDTFTYQISDGNGGTARAAVEVTIQGTPNNGQPAATNLTQTTLYSAGATNVPPGSAIVVTDPNDGIASAVDAQFEWDGTQTTFPAGGAAQGNIFNAPAQTASDGFALKLVFVPTSADLAGGVTAPVYEIGGTSNGHGIYLYDGIPHLLVKMNGGNADLASGLTDTDWTGSVISVPLSASALPADQAADLALIFSLDAVQWSLNGGATQSVALTNRGSKENWYGNLSVTIGERSSSGNNGGTRQDGSGLFAYPTLSDITGVVTDCRLWNASDPASVVIDADLVTATLTMTPAEGGLSVPAGASFDGTTWTYTGTAAQLTHAFTGLEFLPNGTTPVDVAVDIRDGEEDGAAPVTGTLTFAVDTATALEAWRVANGFSSDGSGLNEGDGDDFDIDGLFNLLEFGFGTDPTSSDNATLNPDGSVNGTPTTASSGGGGGVTFDALFNRRDDFGTSGSVSYTVQFSGDLITFFDSTAPVTIVTDSTDDPAYHVASVPYPGLLPNGQKANYFRVKVTVVP